MTELMIFLGAICLLVLGVAAYAVREVGRSSRSLCSTLSGALDRAETRNYHLSSLMIGKLVQSNGELVDVAVAINAAELDRIKMDREIDAAGVWDGRGQQGDRPRFDMAPATSEPGDPVYDDVEAVMPMGADAMD